MSSPGCPTSTPSSSTAGKVEIESVEEGRDEQIIDHLLRSAVLSVFRERVPMDQLRAVVEGFDDARIVNAGEDVVSADYVSLLAELPGLREPVLSLTGGDESPAAASAVEFVLEGLHLSKRLNKEAVAGRAQDPGARARRDHDAEGPVSSDPAPPARTSASVRRLRRRCPRRGRRRPPRGPRSCR